MAESMDMNAIVQVGTEKADLVKNFLYRGKYFTVFFTKKKDMIFSL